MLYYIAYTIIGVSLGGILFIFIKKLPQIMSSRKSELEDLREIIEHERERDWFSFLRDFDFSAIRSWTLKIWSFSKRKFFMVKDSFLRAVRDISQLVGRFFRISKDKGAGFLKGAGGLFSRIKFSVPLLPAKREEKLPSDKKEKEFFSELLKKDKKASQPAEQEKEEGDGEARPRKSSEEQPEKVEPEKEDKEDTLVEREGEEPQRQESSPEEKIASEEEAEEQRWIRELKKNPKDENAYANLGFLYYKQSKYEKAQSCLRIAKKLGFESDRLERVLDSLDQIT